MKKYLSLIFFLFIFLINTKAQDQIINARNVNIQITNPNLAGGGSNAVSWNSINVAYIFAPISPDYGFCVSVVNNNPTSSHSFTVTAFETGDSSVIDFSHNIGRYTAINIQGVPSPVSPNTTNYFYIRSTGGAKVALKFSGSTTQAGNPDTVDIYAVQTTTGSCGTVLSGNPNVTSVSELSAQTFSNSTGFVFTNTGSVNPGINAGIVSVGAAATSKAIIYDKAIISSTGAGTISFIPFTTLPTGCTGQIGLSTNIISANPVTPTAVVGTGCTGFGATVDNAFPIIFAANTTFTLDLTGYIASNNNGLEFFTPAAITGTVTIKIFWHEK